MIAVPKTDVDTLAREIVAESRRYRALRRAINELTESRLVDAESIDLLALLLEEFRDELAMHFALENATQSTGDAADAAPRLAGESERLAEEQDQLYLESCEIAELMSRRCASDEWFDEAPVTIPQALVDRWRLLEQRLAQHDASERELIYDAFFVDIGEGD